jgi:hypothetical protein
MRPLHDQRAGRLTCSSSARKLRIQEPTTISGDVDVPFPSRFPRHFRRRGARRRLRTPARGLRAAAAGGAAGVHAGPPQRRHLHDARRNRGLARQPARRRRRRHAVPRRGARTARGIADAVEQPWRGRAAQHAPSRRPHLGQPRVPGRREACGRARHGRSAHAPRARRAAAGVTAAVATIGAAAAAAERARTTLSRHHLHPHLVGRGGRRADRRTGAGTRAATP